MTKTTDVTLQPCNICWLYRYWMSVSIWACGTGTPGCVLKTFGDYLFNKVAELLFISKVTLLKLQVYLCHLWKFSRYFCLGRRNISREVVGSVGFVVYPESEMRCRPNFRCYSLTVLVFRLMFSLSKELKCFCFVTVYCLLRKKICLCSLTNWSPCEIGDSSFRN